MHLMIYMHIAYRRNHQRADLHYENHKGAKGGKGILQISQTRTKNTYLGQLSEQQVQLLGRSLGNTMRVMMTVNPLKKKYANPNVGHPAKRAEVRMGHLAKRAEVRMGLLGKRAEGRIGRPAIKDGGKDWSPSKGGRRKDWSPSKKGRGKDGSPSRNG